MIYSKNCDNPESGFVVDPLTRQATCKQQGYDVFTTEEVHKIMQYRRERGMIGLTSHDVKMILRCEVQ